MLSLESVRSSANFATQRDFAPEYSTIPPYGRWQQFEAGGIPRIDNLINSWPSTVDSQEKTRRLLDLFVVSVLLDVGADVTWAYQSIEDGRIYRRCEGLAIASLEIFKAGMFSSDPEQPCQVDSAGLGKLSSRKLADALQVSEHNPLDGLGGRTDLLVRLADALEDQHLFGVDARPGNMLGQHHITFRDTFKRTLTHRMSRLSPRPSFNSHNPRTCYTPPHSLESPPSAPCRRLASQPHYLQLRSRLRRLSPFDSPNFLCLAKDNALPQINSMALLLTHAPHDPPPSHPIRGRRAAYGPPRSPQRRSTHGHRTFDTAEYGREERAHSVRNKRRTRGAAERGGCATV